MPGTARLVHCLLGRVMQERPDFVLTAIAAVERGVGSHREMRLRIASIRTLGVIGLCCAAAALYVILPAGHELDFISFCAAYVFACLLGIASHMPGGIGAFEATMLNTVPAPSAAALLASLLLFRVLYYLVPFVLALALLGADEALRRWNSLRAAMSRPEGEG